jgi:hypothetical protein
MGMRIQSLRNNAPDAIEVVAVPSLDPLRSKRFGFSLSEHLFHGPNLFPWASELATFLPKLPAHLTLLPGMNRPAGHALASRGLVVLIHFHPNRSGANFCDLQPAGDDVDRFDLHHFSSHSALLSLC